MTGLRNCSDVDRVAPKRPSQKQVARNDDVVEHWHATVRMSSTAPRWQMMRLTDVKPVALWQLQRKKGAGCTLPAVNRQYWFTFAQWYKSP